MAMAAGSSLIPPKVRRGRNVDRYGIFKELLALCPAALAVGVRDQRGEAVGHSDSEYERNRENTIGQ